MKKRNSLLILSLYLCLGQVFAQTSPQSETLRVWMDDISIKADGETITYIQVYEHDIIDYTAFNMSLIVPNGIKIASVKSGRGTQNAIDLSVRAAETHSISCNMPNETLIKIICTSSANDEFYSDDEEGKLVNELFKIGLIADNNAINGIYTIKSEGVDFILKPGKSNDFSYSPATSPTFQLTITGGQDATDIETIKSEINKVDSYDLLGRKSKESYNGIYIQNGKKIIKKKK